MSAEKHEIAPPIYGIFIAGATGTRFSSREISIGMQDAYGPGNSQLIPSSVSADRPRGGAIALADTLAEHSGHKVHIYLHSAGGAQLHHGLKEMHSRHKGIVDLSSMTIVPIDVPPSSSVLMKGLKKVGTPALWAADGLATFQADARFFNNDQALRMLRVNLPELINGDFRNLDKVEETWQRNYTGWLDTDTRTEVRDVDRQLAPHADDDTSHEDVKRLLLQRGEILRPHVQRIYKGLSPAQVNPDHIRRPHWSPADVTTALTSMATVASNRPWEMLKSLQEAYRRGEGPRVFTVFPEFGVYVTPEIAGEIYKTGDEIIDNSTVLEGSTHASLGLTAEPLSVVRSKIIYSAPRQ